MRAPEDHSTHGLLFAVITVVLTGLLSGTFGPAAGADEHVIGTILDRRLAARASRTADATTTVPVVEEAAAVDATPVTEAPTPEPAPAEPPLPPPLPPLPDFLPMFATHGDREAALYVTGQGWGNGHIPPDGLAEAAPGCGLLVPAAPQFASLLAHASAAGFPLQINDCYRDFRGQEIMRWDWCMRGACHLAAVPGHSSHGSGVAVDIRLADRKLTHGDPAFAWLTENGPRFGFRQPDWALPGSWTAESWHWEYFGPVDRAW